MVQLPSSSQRIQRSELDRALRHMLGDRRKDAGRCVEGMIRRILEEEVLEECHEGGDVHWKGPLDKVLSRLGWGEESWSQLVLLILFAVDCDADVIATMR